MDYLFLRHAETEFSDRREWHGKADPPLSPKGKEHAALAAQALCESGSDIGAILTSDCTRAVQTASVFGLILRRRVVMDPDLRERDLGEWAGLTQSEIERGWPGQLDAWRDGRISGPPGGETDEQVAKRVVQTLLSHSNRGPSPRPKLVIAHAGLLRGLLAIHGERDEEIHPLCGRWLRLTPDDGSISVGDRVMSL